MILGSFEKYLLIINIIGFILYVINTFLYKHTAKGQIDNLLTIVSLAGGALGMLIGILIFDRIPQKENMMSRVFVICIFVLWIVIYLVSKGFIKTKLSLTFLEFLKFFGDHKIFLFYLIVINFVTIIAFALDKIAAIKRDIKSRIRIITLLGLAFIGGSIGAFLGMYIFKHKTQKDYFTVGVPLIFIMQVVVIFYLMNAKFN